MDVYVSIDMEGVAGVATREQCRRGADDYDIGRRLMTGEANAAVDGAFRGGAERVVVNDAHGDMANLIPDELDPRAELIIGSPKITYSMMEGIDERSFSVALFIGYHAGAGVEAAVLAHTYSGASFYDVRLNGRSVTETELNALVAGVQGIPVGLVTGDDKICALAEERLAGVRTVSVKRGHSFTVGASLSPAEARTAITEAAEHAVRGAGDLEPVSVAGPFTIEVDLTDLRRAELCSLVPGVEREGRTVRYASDDFIEAFRCMRAWMYLATSAWAAS
jgi:D-amino peptidase